MRRSEYVGNDSRTLIVCYLLHSYDFRIKYFMLYWLTTVSIKSRYQIMFFYFIHCFNSCKTKWCHCASFRKCRKRYQNIPSRLLIEFAWFSNEIFYVLLDKHRLQTYGIKLCFSILFHCFNSRGNAITNASSRLSCRKRFQNTTESATDWNLMRE